MMSLDEDRPKSSALFKRSATPSPKPSRAGRYLKPRKSDFVEESAYLSLQNRGQVWQHKSQQLQTKVSDLKAENKQLKIDLMHSHTRMLQQTKRCSLEVASANSMLREFKLQMQTRELDFQKEVLNHRNTLIKYQRALQDVAQLLASSITRGGDRQEIGRGCLTELNSIRKRIEGKELDLAIEQLKGACVFTLEEPTNYYSPSNSGKELLSTARFKDVDVSVD
mmetsp:Transcript_15693/g.28629  ORF Transcript_15693/g.28629 Transcript_15693/m.28629 type:complete len:223 (-) Transcript_15693:1651-2319(-)